MARLHHLLGASLVLLAACGGGGPPPLPASSIAGPSLGSVESTYRVGAGDQIRVTVYGEDDLSGEYTLDGAGAVSMPLLGQVQLAGLTSPEVEQKLATSLNASYLLNPRVNVEVLNYRPFYIIGEVMAAGEFPYQDGISVLNAVAMAGGYSYRARTSRMTIQRGGQTFEIDNPAVEPVQPGDVITIAERLF